MNKKSLLLLFLISSLIPESKSIGFAPGRASISDAAETKAVQKSSGPVIGSFSDLAAYAGVQQPVKRNGGDTSSTSVAASSQTVVLGQVEPRQGKESVRTTAPSWKAISERQSLTPKSQLQSAETSTSVDSLSTEKSTTNSLRKQSEPVVSPYPSRNGQAADTVQSSKAAVVVAVQPANEKVVSISGGLSSGSKKELVDVLESAAKFVQPVPQKEKEVVPVENVAVKQSTGGVKHIEAIAAIQPTQPVQTIQSAPQVVQTPSQSKTAQIVSPSYKAQPVLAVQPSILVASKTSSVPSVPASTYKTLPATVVESKPTLSVQTISSKPSTTADLTLSNTIYGKNNLVTGTQNRISASNSHIVGNNNYVIDQVVTQLV